MLLSMQFYSFSNNSRNVCHCYTKLTTANNQPLKFTNRNIINMKFLRKMEWETIRPSKLKGIKKAFCSKIVGFLFMLILNVVQ